MQSFIVKFISLLELILWESVVPVLVLFMGVWLFISSRAFSVRKFPSIVLYFFHCLKKKESQGRGIHPLKLFFSSLGGSLGVGNIVIVCGAIHIGGPGVLFWMWVTAFLGMLIKYAEIYLGIKYRKSPASKKSKTTAEEEFKGGALYFLQKSFPSAWPAKLMAFFLCIYGVEVFTFHTIKDAFAENSSFSPLAIVIFLLVLVILGGMRGLRRLTSICSFLVPFFILLFCSMVFWVLGKNIEQIPSMLSTIVHSAFTGHAMVGGFVGSSCSMALYRGFQVVCYSADVGVGYASMLHSQTEIKQPHKQASLAVLDVFIDTVVVSTLSGLLVLITGVWKEPLPDALFVQKALGCYFPYVSLFMPILLFLLGYTTIIAYLYTGKKCAQFLSPKWGGEIFSAYALFAFVLFHFFSNQQALSLMMIAGGFLIIINILGIFRLRREVIFDEQ